MKILTDFKRNNKSEYYKFFDDKKVFIISKEDLYKRMATRNIKVKNAYIRGSSIVVTGDVWRAKFKNRCLIPISMIDIMAKPFKIDSIFDINVTPDMLDDTALSFIEKIDNAKPEKDVYKYGKFSTPFGVCGMDSLSSGCKTALWGYINQRDNNKILLDLTSTGLNAIVVLLDYLSSCDNVNIAIGFRCIPLFYNNDFDNDYLFRDISDNRIRTFLGFFCAHPLMEE